MRLRIALWLMKGVDNTMIALLLTSQIMRSKITFAEVPTAFKAKVKENLIDEGLEELAK